MNLNINYNGADITDSVDLESCVLYDRYGGLLDNIKMVINDKDIKWSKYKVKKGDKIIIKTDGYSTGAMYIDKFDEKDERFIIDATSLKSSKKVVKSKAWSNVRLSEILNDCAGNNGLKLKTYGISDHTYESLVRIQKTDLEFTSKICQREGYSVKVDNDCLVVFNEKYMESQNSNLTITPDDVRYNYDFSQSGNCVSSVTVSCYNITKGMIKYTAVDRNIVGSSKVITEKVSSQAEAMRFAYGHLRNYNKNHIIGRMQIPYNAGISGGTVLKADGFGDYDGNYIVTEVAHNVKREFTSIKIRRVLNY